MICLPAGTIKFITVFLWCHADIFFKGHNKVTLRCKCQIVGNLNGTVIRVLEQIFGAIQFSVPDILANADIQFFLK